MFGLLHRFSRSVDRERVVQREWQLEGRNQKLARFAGFVMMDRGWTWTVRIGLGIYSTWNEGHMLTVGTCSVRTLLVRVSNQFDMRTITHPCLLSQEHNNFFPSSPAPEFVTKNSSPFGNSDKQRVKCEKTPWMATGTEVAERRRKAPYSCPTWTRRRSRPNSPYSLPIEYTIYVCYIRPRARRRITRPLIRILREATNNRDT